MKHLDLFSGIGGFALALSPIVETVAYCEIDAGCRGVLQNNMAKRLLRTAPIFPDVTAIRPADLPDGISIVTCGFPCQDISQANPFGYGVRGARSGLIFVVLRLIAQLSSVRVVFLENVEAIVRKGLSSILETVGDEFHATYGMFTGYDVGAPHQRRRWYCLLIRRGTPTDTLPRCPTDHLQTWKGSSPQRLCLKKKHPDPTYNRGFRSRYSMLGNAIVPQCAVFAWNTLVSLLPPRHVITTHARRKTPCATHEVRDVKAICVSRTTGQKIATSLQLVDPMDVNKIKYVMNAWRTPTARDTFNIQYKSIGPRLVGNLFAQIWYDKATQQRFNTFQVIPRDLHMYYDVNPRFIEYMMGYPANWTRV
jgi:hypothetical protein